MKRCRCDQKNAFRMRILAKFKNTYVKNEDAFETFSLQAMHVKGHSEGNISRKGGRIGFGDGMKRFQLPNMSTAM